MANISKIKVGSTTYDVKDDVAREQLSELPDTYFSLNNLDCTAISSDADFNDYITAGNYKVTAGSVMRTLSNRPGDIAGRLMVATLNVNASILQIFIDSTEALYTRIGSLTRNTWTDWKKYATSQQLPWYNKKVVVFGDSRTWYDGHAYTENTKSALIGTTCIGFQQTIAKLTGATITSQGVSGENSIEICSRIRAFNFTGYDAVLLEGGVNDWLQTCEIGQLQSIGSTFDTNTLYGAWQSAIEYIQTNYPSIKIFMIIPAIAWNIHGQLNYYYVEEKRRLADFYHLPCIDLYDKCGITTLNRDYYYADNISTTGWRLHFNDEGNALIGYFIGEAMNSASTDLISTGRNFELHAKYGIPIPSNSDLNDYTISGNYYVPNSTVAQTLSNRAGNVGGRLTVVSLVSDISTFQMYMATGGKIYWRVYSSEAWTDWGTVFNRNDISDLSTKYVSTDYSFSEMVSSGSDLNNYTTPGNYRIANSEIAQSITNCPSSTGGKFIVMTLVGTASVFHMYISTGGHIYIRVYSMGSWVDWIRICRKSELDSSVQAIHADCVATKHTIGTAISENADLNNYITPGNFYIPTVAIAKTLLNCPTYLAGRLTVCTSNSVNAYFQIYQATNGAIYIRSGTLTYGYNEWSKIAVSSDLDSIVSSQNDGRGAYNAMQPIIRSATYNIAFANAYNPISLKSYIGDNQNVHPKVLYFSSGYNGHKYWMAYTPYPYSNDHYENPCIAYSDDGYEWTNLDINPLATSGNTVTIDGTDYTVSYNSDTHLVYRSDSDTLECWYRAVVDDVNAEVIYRRTTTDCETWTNAEVLKIGEAGSNLRFLSPCVNWNGSGYDVWVRGNASGSAAIDYYTVSSNGKTWTYVRSFNLSFSDDGLTVAPWHLDVIKDGSTYIMLIMCRNGKQIENNACSLFITTSTDNITYTSPYKVVGGANNWDKYMYRSSIVKVGSVYRIYYSAGTGGKTSIYSKAVWGIGITESTSLSNFYGRYQ